MGSNSVGSVIPTACLHYNQWRNCIKYFNIELLNTDSVLELNLLGYFYCRH